MIILRSKSYSSALKLAGLSKKLRKFRDKVVDKYIELGGAYGPERVVGNIGGEFFGNVAKDSTKLPVTTAVTTVVTPIPTVVREHIFNNTKAGRKYVEAGKKFYDKTPVIRDISRKLKPVREKAEEFADKHAKPVVEGAARYLSSMWI